MNRTSKVEKTRQLRKARPGMKLAAQAVVLSTASAFGVAGAQAGPNEGAEAQQAPAPSQHQAVAAPDQPLNFTILATDLTTALEEYGHATGLKVHSRIANDQIAGFRSRGAQGVMTPGEALRKILAETGLQGELEKDGRTVDVSIRNTEQVEVTASAQANLQQFQQSLVDTAQTIALVPQYILSEQGDTTPAGQSAECSRHLDRGRRRRISRRQPDDPWLQRAQRYLLGRYPRLRIVLPGQLQLRRGGCA